MSDTDNIVDLDALVPQQAIIRFGGQEITVKPPSTGDLFKLASMGSKLADMGDMASEDVVKTLNNLNEQIGVIIPELANQNLNTKQLLVIVKMISDMAMPPDAKELEKLGISPATDPKKAS